MDDALLTSLCKICHIDPPKYTCPRCLAETCSLTCSKRHKLWASCNGVRDPTVYKPISEVATPSGIDHDYNFIHSIEHGISRSEKVLIEDLGLVTHEELKRARMGEDAEPPRKRLKANEPPGEVCIRKVLEAKQITVHKAPRGMRRNQENTTSWSRKRKTIDWQVEWLRAGPVGRTLYKISGAKPIGDQYDALCNEERRMNMTPDERREANKKKASESKIRAAQRRTADSVALFPSAPRALLQDPATGAWQLAPTDDDACDELQHPATPMPVTRNYHLYFHRPLTPASFPKVLVHLDLAQPLTDLLAHRELLEYPTIYVLEQDPLHLPSQFMREEDFLAATGERRAGDPSAGDEEESGSSSDSSESSSSSEEEAEVEKKDEL